MGSVLIVDDEAVIRSLLERVLASAGYEVRTAADADAALLAVAQSTPDVVLCDVHMPGPNGLWLADRVRDCAPTTAIVLATADADVPPYESLRNGVVAYVLKPLRPEQVLRAVQEGMRWSAAAADRAPRSRAPRRLPAGPE